jgi:hypothetical protein
VFGQTIPITLTFSQAVDVTGTPLLALNSGGTASYSSGSGTSTLTFNYTVGLNEFAANLDEASSTALTLNGGTIDQHATTTPAVLTLPAPQAAGSLGANKSITVDGRPAKVSGLSTTTADGTYGYGAVIPVTVTFDKSVDVTGSPQLALNSGSTLTYTGGNVTNVSSLTFTLTVGLTDTTNGQRLDAASTTALALNGGTIQDDADPAAPATLTLPAAGAAGSLSATHNILVDGTPGKPTNVTSTLANGTYGIGTTVPISITFTKAVTVNTTGGVPSVALNSGGSAAYTGGSGSTTLTFSYTVAAGQDAADLDYASTTALTTNGGSIIDMASGTPATLTLPTPGTAGSLGANKNLVIDTTPHVSGVTSTLANGTYGYGQVVPITVTFTAPVVVTGTPLLVLNAGGSAAASYTGGTGTTVMSFTYTVGLGDLASPLDYASTGALSLNGGTIKDAANTNVSATLTLPAPGTAGSLSANKTINVDGTPARPSNLTTTIPDGSYGIGSVIPITITFTKPVDVTGSPQLALNSGGTAVYSGGNATNVTALTFTYTVQPGQNAADLDEASAAALTLNGGTIQDHASNTPAPLTLPAPQAAGSLGANANIKVDTAGPTVQQFRVKFGSKWYNLIGSTRIDVPWKVTAIQVVFDQPVTAANVHSLTGLTSSALTGLGTGTLTWKLASPIIKGSFNTSLAASGANAIKNAAGDVMNAFSQAFQVLYGDVNDDQKVDAADEAAVRASLPAPYQPPTSGYNLFADLDGNGFVNLTDFGIARSRRGATLP